MGTSITIPKYHVDPIVRWRWECSFPDIQSLGSGDGRMLSWWRVPRGRGAVGISSSHDLFTKQMVETPPTLDTLETFYSCALLYSHIGHIRLLYPKTSQFMIANKTSIATHNLWPFYYRKSWPQVDPVHLDGLTPQWWTSMKNPWTSIRIHENRPIIHDENPDSRPSRSSP